MADGASSVCVKCENKLDNRGEKLIKCSGHCKNFLHQMCSAFKPSELKFFEQHTKNIRWFCDSCVNSHSDPTVRDLHAIVIEMYKKVEKLLELASEQTKKIDCQAVLINNMQAKQQLQPSSAREEPVNKPITRSKTTTDVSTNPRSEIKLSSISNKKPDKQKHNTPSKDEQKPVEKPRTDSTLKSAEKLKQETSTDSKYTHETKTIRGCRNNTSLKAAENRKWVFLSQFTNTTTVDDIKGYLMENHINIINCYKLLTKSPDIAAFKMAVDNDTYEKMFDADLWPLNVIVRPFRSQNFRKLGSLDTKS